MSVLLIACSAVLSGARWSADTVWINDGEHSYRNPAALQLRGRA
ncbi:MULTISPECIES: hypothetical protein [unclassified Streptomyces]|nr:MULTISPECIES: hypothetical protein [unclassified Streptomyces]